MNRLRLFLVVLALGILGRSGLVAAAPPDPRALSIAFRESARKAIPAVVTIIAYGQGVIGQEIEQSPLRDPDANPQEENSTPGDQAEESNEEGPEPNAGDDEDEEGRDDEGDDDEDQAKPPSPDSLTPFRDQFPELGSLGQPTGLGSGVVISTDGVILTNHHVVAGARRVVVRFQDGEERIAKEIRSDPTSDVATLRVDAPNPLAAAKLGSADDLQIGDWILAIGSPFQLEATVSAGIISAKGREISRIRRVRLLQTDAAINPGNSGGPVVDMEGKVVGISTAIATRTGVYQGIGFAIPIDQAKWIADELVEHGKVRRAALGIQITDINGRIARRTGFAEGQGVLVVSVVENSAADKAGIEPMDVILSVGDNRTRNSTALRETVERMPIGSTQSVEISRGGETKTVEVVLQPAD